MSPHVRAVAEFCIQHACGTRLTLDMMTQSVPLPVSVVRSGVLICERVNVLEATENDNEYEVIAPNAGMNNLGKDKHDIESELSDLRTTVEALEEHNAKLTLLVTSLESRLAAIADIAGNHN